MKKNSIYLSLLGIALCCEITYGQYIPTVEEGKEWTIQLYYGLGSSHYEKYALWCDTMVDEHVYLTIYKNSEDIVGFLREDTTLQEVYFRDVGAEFEEIVFSYKGETGDTINLSSGDLIIQEVLYEEHFGALRKVLVISDFYRLIEGAGNSRYGIISNYTLPNPWPSLFDLQMSNATCEIVTSTVELAEGIAVYPNPFTDVIQMVNTKSNPVNYELYNMYGTRLLGGGMEIEESLDISALMPGMYLLVIDDKTIKLVKN